MGVALFIQSIIAFPAIGTNSTASGNVISNKGYQRLWRTAGYDGKADAAQFVAVTLDCGGNDGFTGSTPAPFAGFLAADEKLFNFNRAGKFVPVCADRTASQRLQPGPRGIVAAKAQEFLQVDCINAGFSGGKPPSALTQ